MAFIVFEGLDAAGKSTLMNGVESALSSRSVEFVATQDPGTTPLGDALRKLILTNEGEAPVSKAELLMYQAARVQMVDRVIRPALQNGTWILADRFYSSTLAFQVHARGLDSEMVYALNEYVAGTCVPDLFVFIDISVSESSRRKQSRSIETGEAQDRMEREAQSFQEKVRQGYLHQAKAAPDRWLVLDGLRSPDQLRDDVLKVFEDRQWLG